MRNQIKKLLASDLTSYRISVETGIPQSKIGYLRNGKAKLDNLSLAYAEKLQNYYKKVELEMKINEIRKELENTERSYYIEYYANIEEALEERDMSREELNDRVDAVGFEIVEDVPVIIYENPESSLFNVAFITEDMTTEDILNELE